jgi:signal transduction histidine kinase
MHRILEIVKNRHFWTVAIMLAICGFFHYFSPQIPLLQQDPFPMTRQAVVRIIFLLPVAAGAFAFDRTGGVVTLGLTIIIMLPRIFFVSEQPIDAFFETLGVALVGYILVWMIDIQEKEKRLRQRAVEELETVNAIALTLTQSHDLEAMLDQALTKILEVVDPPEPKGAIFLLDPWGQNFVLRAHRGLPPEFLAQGREIPLEECLCGLTAEKGEVLVVRRALNHPRHARCVETGPHSHVCVPLKSRERLLGVMDFCLPITYPFDDIDKEMFGAIGRQAGVAVENARLCENLRYYVRQITRAQEDERQRIARELHDDTAQRLIDLSRRLDALAYDQDPASLAQVEQIQDRIEVILQGVRRFSRDLRPSVLDDLGLLPAVKGLLADLENGQIKTQLQVSGQEHRLSPEVELELFRIVQEALSNVRKHAQASQVVVAIVFGADRVQVSIQDNGRGFELVGNTSDLAATGRFGLVGIKERAQLLRGHFQVQSTPGEGTVVTVDVPVQDLEEPRPPRTPPWFDQE